SRESSPCPCAPPAVLSMSRSRRSSPTTRRPRPPAWFGCRWTSATTARWTPPPRARCWRTAAAARRTAPTWRWSASPARSMAAAGKRAGGAGAVERGTGAPGGGSGSFARVHRALLRANVPQEWTVAVVAGSGTEALAGLEGSLRISVRDGQHHYAFEYLLD